MRCDNSPEKFVIRDADLRQIQQQGRYAWRVASGCTRQSLAENAMFRLQYIFGSRFRARRLDNQRVEGWVKCRSPEPNGEVRYAGVRENVLNRRTSPQNRLR